MIKQIIGLLVILILVSTPLFSESNIRFDHISIRQGLSQSSVFSILQDKEGFMWFCTEDGLNKYDGYNFTVYKPVPKQEYILSDNYLWSICEDGAGMLWVGTNGSGITRFDPSTITSNHYKTDKNDPKSLSNNFIRVIFRDKSGTLWIGTEGGGLNKVILDEATQTDPVFYHYKHNPGSPNSLSNNFVRAVYEDSTGALWLGTGGGGLNRFNPQNDQFICFRNDTKNNKSLSNDFVWAICEDKEGTLWIGTEDGLNAFNREKEVFTRYFVDADEAGSSRCNEIRTILEDKTGVLWIGTYGGLIVFNRAAETFKCYKKRFNQPQGLSSNEIPSLYEDRSGVLWIGTEGGGINKYSRNKEKFQCYDSILYQSAGFNDFIWSIWEDSSGTLWLGTNGSGLAKCDISRENFRYYQNNIQDPGSLSDNIVKYIYEDRSGVLWVGTEKGGLNKFNPTTDSFTHYKSNPENPFSLSDNHVRYIFEDKEGTLWVGTERGGLNKFEKENGVFKRYKHNPDDSKSLSYNDIYAIFEDSQGILWIGTWGGGLNRFDRDRERFIRYQTQPSDPNSLSHNLVLTIHESRAGLLWIGTSGGGLNQLDRSTGKFIHYTEEDGLPNNVVYGILEDVNGNLWMTTNQGLSKFDPKTKRFKNYTEDDGLQDNEFNGNAYHKSRKSGEMFVGGIEGFNAFFPDRIKDNTYNPPIVITAFLKFNKKVNLGKNISDIEELNISYKYYYFSFEFSALDYTVPLKNKYAYKLMGLHEDWIYTDAKKRFASFTTLPAGTYLFRVKGSNNDGVWNEEGTSIKITIVPPLWGTWYFKVFVVLFLVGLATLWYRTRIRNLTLKLRSEIEINTVLSKHNISKRENEIIKLLLEGKSNKEIEDELYISSHTVKNHVYNIYQKLGVKNRGELVILLKTTPQKPSSSTL